VALADFLQCAALIAARYAKEKDIRQLSRSETKVFHHVLDKRRYLDFNFAFFRPALASQKNSKIKNGRGPKQKADHIWEDVL
jgi:hypothetical protein